tara:strand:- start:136980 stop:137846 length:867 start_codon:yes stop_codon:yes gene_type:complete
MSSPFASLDYIPSFAAVMTHGSLSGAARALSLAQPTVRRHIDALEAELNTALFTRAANGLTPTDVAHDLLPMAQSVLDEAAALHRAASARRDTLAGVVRLTTSRVAAAHVFPLALAPLRDSAPGLRFEIAATDRPENLARRAADIALRFTAPAQQSLIAQRLPDVAVGLFAAPGVALPDSACALGDMPMILDDREGIIAPAMARFGLPLPRNVVLRCDDPLTQITHIQAGYGLGFCQVRLAARLGLRRALPEIAYQMPAWLVMHEDQARTPRLRHVFDHLKTTLPDLM